MQSQKTYTDKPLIIDEFEKSVKNKFNLYNSLFLNLPFRNVSNIGMLIPLMHHVCKEGLDQGKDPIEILDKFFGFNAGIDSENEKIDFMFRVIQYIERQIVLYDSVEDAAFPKMLSFGDHSSLSDYFHLTERRNRDDFITEKLSSFSTRIVLTAHPTQFYSPSVLDIIARLRDMVNENDLNGIDITLQQLGLTSLINTKKPSPLDEAGNVIYFLRNVYYDAAGDLYSDIKRKIKNKNFDNPDLIKLGFWPGGDRDGNPFVTFDITSSVADELRMTLMKCYYRDVKDLSGKLTFRGVEEIVQDLRNRLYTAMFNSETVIKYRDIMTPLLSIRSMLLEKFNSLFIGDVDKLIDKVKIFKTHFASLDIRQNHDVHKRVVTKILKKERVIVSGLHELKDDELISILTQEKFSVAAEHFSEDIIKDTILNISQLKDIQTKNGEEGCNRYIISNSEDIFSVLFVFGLLRWCGRQEEEIPFDIIPLFESMQGMKNAELVMDKLFGIEEYRTHIRRRHNRHTIMLGFSDGTKDGGYMQANWSIFKAKENLSELCAKHGIKVIFFDGRGGPPARGGGKTHRFYAAQSNKTANHGIELTIQGQTISSKYGTKEHFIHNVEQLLTAGLSNSLYENENIISDEARALMDELAVISFKKYNDLKNHEMFVPYLENKSTLKYYGKTKIGSRPSKRGSKDNLELRDLRAIPFVGSWSQLKQNVPGYFGVGTAIQSLVKEGKLEALKKLFKEVSFFKALILNSMMSLSKCNFNLTAYIAKDKEYAEFWRILKDEYELSKKMILLISEYELLMEEEPEARESIEIRERIVLPLLVIQQYALQKIEENPGNRSIYEKIVRRSLYGNINASRNSA